MVPTTDQIERAKVYTSKLDARWASAIAQQVSYSEGAALQVCGGYVAVIQFEGEHGEQAEAYVANTCVI